MNKLSELVHYRDGKPDDENMILATWVQGLYHSNQNEPWFASVPQYIFNEEYRKIIKQLLAKPGIEKRIACLNEDEDVVLGYAIFEGDTLHWVYVKSSWRRLGIARNITPKKIKWYTHLTPIGRSIAQTNQFIFNPFKL